MNLLLPPLKIYGMAAALLAGFLAGGATSWYLATHFPAQQFKMRHWIMIGILVALLVSQIIKVIFKVPFEPLW